MPSEFFQHGNFKIPNTKLREGFAHIHERVGGEFPDLPLMEQRALLDLCTVPGDKLQTEQNCLELLHYLFVQNGVRMSVIIADIRQFSEKAEIPGSKLTTQVAMRLSCERYNARQKEHRRALTFSSAPERVGAVVA